MAPVAKQDFDFGVGIMNNSGGMKGGKGTNNFAPKSQKPPMGGALGLKAQRSLRMDQPPVGGSESRMTINS